MQSQLPHVRLENFEGPFDLLIELARSKKVDLADISLSDITEAFLEYVQEVSVPSALQGDFAVVAALLLYLKIQQLMPQEVLSEEDEEAFALSDRVRIYDLYRQQADYIKSIWGVRRMFLGRQLALRVTHSVDMPAVSLSSLQTAFEQVATKVPPPVQPRAHLTQYGKTLKEWLSDFEARVRGGERVHYQDVVKQESPRDQAVSFLAVLQLARDEKVLLEQASIFTDLFVTSYE